MVKKLLLLSFVVLLNASSLDDKIKEFVGEEKYLKHNKLINIIFKDSDEYYDQNNKINLIKVLTKLKDNGLIEQNFYKPVEFILKLETKSNCKIFVRTIFDALANMGFNYIAVKNASKSNDSFKLIISIQTQYIVDPIYFYNQIIAKGGKIINISKKSSYGWSYTIDSLDLFLNEAIPIEGDALTLKRPIKDYYISLKPDEIEEITIKSYLSNRWYPFISYYDDKLNLLKIVKIDKVTKEYKIELSQNYKYIRIGDIYTLNNIKQGLKIETIFKQQGL